MKRLVVLISLFLLTTGAAGYFAGEELRTLMLAILLICMGGSVIYWFLRDGKRQREEDWLFREAARRWQFLEQIRSQICPVCGYSLIGNRSGICPECGTKLRELLQ